MEAEIIPMCEDQGMAIVPWAALGGGLLLSSQQRREREEKLAGQKSFYELDVHEISVSDALEKVAVTKETTVQAIVGYLLLIFLFCWNDAKQANATGPGVSFPSVDLCDTHCWRPECRPH